MNSVIDHQRDEEDFPNMQRDPIRWALEKMGRTIEEIRSLCAPRSFYTWRYRAWGTYNNRGTRKRNYYKQAKRILNLKSPKHEIKRSKGI